jgi:chromosome segregation ATPase
MDATARTCQQAHEPAYTTSKQVQAWFLGRSRDRWKKKYAELKVESKRLKQRVADVSKSRAGWRDEAEAARQEANALRSRNAELQAELDALADEAQKKYLTLPPWLRTPRSRKFPRPTATPAA